ncbi:MAG: TonB-dependent receptor [Campylobacterota bacterium]|nr:TonB-dependent receptor [Campylobacterota bacterium]
MKNTAFAIMLVPILLIANNISIEDDFLASLDEVSDIASKSKLNIDDMPAFVTILQGKKLELLGIDTIYEALGLVPGVELSMEASGVKQVIFRGVKEKGKVKLLVDGVTINNSYRGSMYYYLDFPIEMIERIEVIRGPGSVLYGSNAISGVVSIITKNSKTANTNRLFVAGSTAPYYKAGLQYAYELAPNSRLSLDGYYQNSDIHIQGGPDKAGVEDESDESLKDYSLGLHLDIDNFTLLARYKQSQAGIAYGIGNYFESKNDKKANNNRSLFIEAKYKNSINNDTDYKFSIGTNRYAQNIETRFLPHPAKGDVIYDGDYAEHNYYGELVLKSDSIENNSLVFGARYEYSLSQKTALQAYFEPTGDPFIPVENSMKPDRKRSIFSLYLNDNYSLTQNIDLVAGLRWDSYSDFGSALSPRLGLIWRANKAFNFKMLYSRSFRAPSWLELYATIPNVSQGNPDLDAETADTIELGSVYRPSSSQTVRFNIYATQIDNLIVREATIYQQKGKNSYYGAEAEWMNSFNSQSEFKMGLSYVDALDNDAEALPDIANFLANMTFLYDFSSDFGSGSVLKYVSSRKRALDDDRDKLDGYALFDQTFSYYYKTLSLSVSIKNLFDTQYEYPAPVKTYVNDYPRIGRTGSISAKWEF